MTAIVSLRRAVCDFVRKFCEVSSVNDTYNSIIPESELLPHELDAALEYCPVGHEVQLANPFFAENRPCAHSKQLILDTLRE